MDFSDPSNPRILNYPLGMFKSTSPIVWSTYQQSQLSHFFFTSPFTRPYVSSPQAPDQLDFAECPIPESLLVELGFELLQDNTTNFQGEKIKEIVLDRVRDTLKDFYMQYTRGEKMKPSGNPRVGGMAKVAHGSGRSGQETNANTRTSTGAGMRSQGELHHAQGSGSQEPPAASSSGGGLFSNSRPQFSYSSAADSNSRNVRPTINFQSESQRGSRGKDKVKQEDTSAYNMSERRAVAADKAALNKPAAANAYEPNSDFEMKAHGSGSFSGANASTSHLQGLAASPHAATLPQFPAHRYPSRSSRSGSRSQSQAPAPAVGSSKYRQPNVREYRDGGEFGSSGSSTSSSDGNDADLGSYNNDVDRKVNTSRGHSRINKASVRNMANANAIGSRKLAEAFAKERELERDLQMLTGQLGLMVMNKGNTEEEGEEGEK